MTAPFTLIKPARLLFPLLEARMPAVRFTTYPTPADKKRLPLAVMEGVPLHDSDPDSAQRWTISFTVSADKDGTAWDYAVSIYFALIQFSEEGAGIDGIGHIGHVTAKKPSPSTGQDYVVSFTVTMQP